VSHDASLRNVTDETSRRLFGKKTHGIVDPKYDNVILPRAPFAGMLFARGGEQELSCRSEIALGVPDPLARCSVRTLQPLRDAPSWKRNDRSAAVFHFHSRARNRAGISRSPERSMSFPHKTFIYSRRSRSGLPRLLGRLALETGPSRTHRERARPLSSRAPSLPRSLTRSLGGCVYLTRDPTLAGCLSSFDPLLRPVEESSLGPVAAGAIEIGLCGRSEIYRDSIIPFRTQRPAVNIGFAFSGTRAASNNNSITCAGWSATKIRYHRISNAERSVFRVA